MRAFQYLTHLSVRSSASLSASMSVSFLRTRSCMQFLSTRRNSSVTFVFFVMLIASPVRKNIPIGLTQMYGHSVYIFRKCVGRIQVSFWSPFFFAFWWLYLFFSDIATKIRPKWKWKFDEMASYANRSIKIVISARPILGFNQGDGSTL